MLPAGALTSPSLPSMPSRRSRKSLCLCMAHSAVSAALSLRCCGTPAPSFLPTPTLRNFKGHWTPIQVGFNFTPYLVPIPIPVVLPVFASVSLLSPSSTVAEPSCGWRGAGHRSYGADEDSSSGTRGSRLVLKAVGWGPCRGIWDGSSVCPSTCLSSPFCNHPRGMHHSVPLCPTPGPVPCQCHHAWP